MHFDYLIYYLVILLQLAKAVWSSRIAASSVIDLMQHVEWNRTTDSTMTPIPGYNSHSTAYRLQGTSRQLVVSQKIVERIKKQLDNSEEFTILAAVKQLDKNSGSIIAFSSHRRSYLELESSGRRDEIRLHYSHGSHLQTETFPYHLSDNQWHTIALGISVNHVQLFIDCNKIYERTISDIDRNFIEDRHLKIWLGQRNPRHAYFKGAIEYVKFIASSQGILDQCPHANVACPTCSQFKHLEHSVNLLYNQIQHLNQKLEAAESRISELEECECLQSCDVNGTKYQHGQSWSPHLCNTCTCNSGVVQCEEQQCPRVSCKSPVTLQGQCCPLCLKRCYHHSRYYDHGQGFSPRHCVKCICRDGKMSCHEEDEDECPALDCPTSQQIQVPGECCKLCTGTDFCGRGHDCHPNATCINLATKYHCQCNKGYYGEDGKVCIDVDECAVEGGHHGHHCHDNTHCVNTPGSYVCECLAGFTRLTDYTCQEHNECLSGAHECSTDAVCTNTYASYQCTCKEGYYGDGFTCQAMCQESCKNGGVCTAPNTCQCRKGFIGHSCQMDLDECDLGIAECHNNAYCVNLPGTYLCQCRQGFYSSKDDNQHGALCRDIDECNGWGQGHDCPAGTRCRNIPGGFQCVCEDLHYCQQGCQYDGQLYQDGSTWKPQNDKCTLCSCQGGNVICDAKKCDCSKRQADLACCPECDIASHCLHQELPIIFYSGETWTYQCQTCQCLEGEIDCWQFDCPILDCPSIKVDKTAGDCCPRCADLDPCHANYNLEVTARSQTCYYNGHVYRSGDRWPLTFNVCTVCECKAGHVCCEYNQTCGHTMEAVTSLDLQLTSKNRQPKPNQRYMDDSATGDQPPTDSGVG